MRSTLQNLLTSSLSLSCLCAGLANAQSAGPGTTLVEGYYWIRAVADPNFHKYLQSKPLYSESYAVLETHTTAGQFQIVDGQLVQLISEPGAPEEFLYANVGTEKVINDESLQVSFNATENTHGTFAWQGDTLTWSTPDVERPNTAAWYVCTDQLLYVNLGAYMYQTPEGCADQTIHYYNDKTANE
ncbi:hypothetical protein FQN55_001563 [Onygenales sp. PD_40]|nr:hypothetical protein FQN55_001563 [Onygenales sp. PD_40]KAK2776249.1 hypothetical protein FQN53_002747 [Emmonsiellopsis sp. PD_33]KAK2792060.1 hypothetical protein FQN52_004170 [Onygenales sp. PD_12]KAK2804235.1 hypothetical protein FQN51_002324 [Onygenales sp. PD_10]